MNVKAAEEVGREDYVIKFWILKPNYLTVIAKNGQFKCFAVYYFHHSSNFYIYKEHFTANFYVRVCFTNYLILASCIKNILKITNIYKNLDKNVLKND